jgi:hypothetical protein
MNELREILITAVAPKLTFGLGDPIDPLDRLDEYRASFAKKRGIELERFGKWIGKALDAPNYPLFEVIGSSFGITLLKLSDNAMSSVFMHG